MALIGTKKNKDIFDNLLADLIPDNIDTYIEPFGGEFGLYEMLNIKPNFSIYNDINKDLYNNAIDKYKDNLFIKCYNEDYKKIIKEFDNEKTFFYFDPPYLDKFYYKYNLTQDEHIELANMIYNIKGKFLLSYQNKPLILKLYNNYNIYRYRGNNYILLPEIAITNY